MNPGSTYVGRGALQRVRREQQRFRVVPGRRQANLFQHRRTIFEEDLQYLVQQFGVAFEALQQSRAVERFRLVLATPDFAASEPPGSAVSSCADNPR